MFSREYTKLLVKLYNKLDRFINKNHYPSQSGPYFLSNMLPQKFTMYHKKVSVDTQLITPRNFIMWLIFLTKAFELQNYVLSSDWYSSGKQNFTIVWTLKVYKVQWKVISYNRRIVESFDLCSFWHLSVISSEDLTSLVCFQCWL